MIRVLLLVMTTTVAWAACPANPYCGDRPAMGCVPLQCVGGVCVTDYLVPVGFACTTDCPCACWNPLLTNLTLACTPPPPPTPPTTPPAPAPPTPTARPFTPIPPRPPTPRPPTRRPTPAPPFTLPAFLATPKPTRHPTRHPTPVPPP
jgi:hypothetical protein